MPKAKAKTTKKAKEPLTRGRGRPKRLVSTSSNETEVSEVPVSSSEIENKTDEEVLSAGSSASATSDSKSKGSAKTNPPPEVSEDEGGNEVGEFYHCRNVPVLVAELRGKTGAVITYVTTDMAHRQFELDERRKLLQMHNEIDILGESFSTSVGIVRSLCSDSKNGTVADAVKTLDLPKTLPELIVRLVAVQPTTPSAYPLMHEVLFEESEEEEGLQMETENAPVTATPFDRKTPRTVFPSPAKMAKYSTPIQNNGVFHFGGQSNRKGILSTNKAPRMPKPGEVIFSESGSPLLQRRIQDDLMLSARAMEHLEILGDDGSKIEFDMVYRGAQDVNKVRGFKEFARDVRGIAATRSTAQPDRLQAPRIKTGSQSCTKGKPIWR